MCSYVRECAPALNICDTGSIHVLLACHGESKVCRLCPEQQSAAASTSEVVVLLCCWAWAKEQKHIILGCIYGDKRQLRCLVWCNFQLSLACSNIQLREMWWESDCLFPGWISKMLLSTRDVPIPSISVHWMIAEDAFIPPQGSADSSQAYILWIFPLFICSLSPRPALLDKGRLEPSCLSQISLYWWDLEYEKSFCIANDAKCVLISNIPFFAPQMCCLERCWDVNGESTFTLHGRTVHAVSKLLNISWRVHLLMAGVFPNLRLSRGACVGEN